MTSEGQARIKLGSFRTVSIRLNQRISNSWFAFLGARVGANCVRIWTRIAWVYMRVWILREFRVSRGCKRGCEFRVNFAWISRAIQNFNKYPTCSKFELLWKNSFKIHPKLTRNSRGNSLEIHTSNFRSEIPTPKPCQNWLKIERACKKFTQYSPNIHTTVRGGGIILVSQKVACYLAFEIPLPCAMN